MSRIKKHLQREYEDWEKVQRKQNKQLSFASKNLGINIGAYLLISIIEFILSFQSHSQTLRADAFNNLSGIVSTLLLMIGIHIAQDIDDDDIVGAPLPKYSLKQRGNDQRIQFTRYRYETVFTLVTGVIMITIAISVIFSGIKGLLNADTRIVPKSSALIGAIIASVIMLLVYLQNRRMGRKLKSAALTAASQDSLSDALTSIGTLISTAGALLFQITWLDGITSIIVGVFILYSGFKIFMETSLNLVDYFDPELEKQYRQVISSIEGVAHISELKAHYNGNFITLDIVIMVNGYISVLEGYRISEEIEKVMRKRFGIIDTDVAFIPDPSSIKDEDF